MLNPPDYSRRHHPILAVLLANPGRAVTIEELCAALPELTEKHIRHTSGVLVGYGSLVRTGGRPRYKDGPLDGALYSAPSPFPLSPRERHTQREREKRRAARAHVLTRRTPEPRTSAQAERYRAAQHARTLTHRRQAQACVLAYLAAHPGPQPEDEIKRHSGVVSSAFREAILDLTQGGHVHVRYPEAHTNPASYWLPLTRDPGLARPLGRRHAEVLEMVQTRRELLGSLTRKVQAGRGCSPAQARALIHDLFHAGVLDLVAVGDTCVVKPGAVPLTLRSARPAPAAQAA